MGPYPVPYAPKRCLVLSKRTGVPICVSAFHVVEQMGPGGPFMRRNIGFGLQPTPKAYALYQMGDVFHPKGVDTLRVSRTHSVHDATV